MSTGAIREPAVHDADGERRRKLPTTELVFDDAVATAAYANFCRISGTPEEVIFDFALNSQPMGNVPETLKIGQRVIVNYYTAKRLLGALHMAVQRHEAAFGVLETDVQKRFSSRSS